MELQGGSFAGGHTRLSHLQMDAMHMVWRHAFLESQQCGLKMAQRRQHRLAIGKCGEGVVSGLLGQNGGLTALFVPAMGGKRGKPLGHILCQAGRDYLAACRAQLVKRNWPLLLIHLTAHALGSVTGAGPLTNLRISAPEHRIICASPDLMRRVWRRHFIVIGSATATPGRQIQCVYLPGCKFQIVEFFSIGRFVKGGDRCLCHGTVMTMLARNIEECGDQDIWFEQTHHLDHLSKRMFSSPMFERLLAGF